MDEVKDPSSPRVRDDGSWSVRRDIDEDVDAANIDLLHPKGRLRIFLESPAVRVE